MESVGTLAWLRELVVRGVLIPLGLRIFLGGGTTVGLRIAAWYSENDLLAPMANYRARPPLPVMID